MNSHKASKPKSDPPAVLLIPSDPAHAPQDEDPLTDPRGSLETSDFVGLQVVENWRKRV